jgi:glycosyltransferase involved in cell wall biosynthesis
MQNCKVLHITTHCGGGVGDTMFGYFSENKTSEHEVVILGYVLENVTKRAKELGIPLHINKTHKEIIDMIPEFDIVLIHIWNHPLMYDFLVRNELPPCRLIMWGHNSGFDAPNIYTKKVLLYPDLFVFTTPLSYETKEMKELSYIFSGDFGGFLEVSIGRHLRKKYFYNIWSTGGFDEYKNITVNKHNGFIIGYVGTVDYAKMHPDFLQMCKEIDIPNVKFIVIGGTKEDEIEAGAKAMGMEDKFVFTGFVPDLPKYLEFFDVFGYPLAPYHYGTCDLVLQIAMASGVVPVVLNNRMENYMVKHNKTGIIVKNKKEYVQAIKDLYNNINLRKELSDNTRKEALERFSLEKLEREWRQIFTKVMEFPKISKNWNSGIKNITAKDVFIEALGTYAKPFIVEEVTRKTVKQVIDKMEGEIEEAIKVIYDVGIREIKDLAKNPSWQTETKGSVHNYHSYFPDDKFLLKWSELMRGKK